MGRALWFVEAAVVRASRAAGGDEKQPDFVPLLQGPRPAQLKETPEHALGYSRGCFGAKVHLLVTDRGVVVGISITPGQRQESAAFQPLRRGVLRRRRRGIPSWPTKLAGDKGYGDPHIRRWLRRRHVEAGMPTRRDQPRKESLDKATDRKRNLIERVLGWYQERRALGARYEKRAVDEVALGMVALIEKILQSGRKRPSGDL